MKYVGIVSFIVLISIVFAQCSIPNQLQITNTEETASVDTQIIDTYTRGAEEIIGDDGMDGQFDGCPLLDDSLPGWEGGPHTSEHKFPRLWANFANNLGSLFVPSTLSDLALFSAQMWMMDAPSYYEQGSMTNWTSSDNPWEYTKAINPSAKIYVYVPGLYFWSNSWNCTYNPDKCAIQSRINEGDQQGDPWWILNPEKVGDQRIYPWVNNALANLSPYDQYPTWFGQYIGENVIDKRVEDVYAWDGVHWDVTNSVPHGISKLSTESDIDENGLIDLYEPNKGKPWINDQIATGMSTMFSSATIAKNIVPWIGNAAWEPGNVITDTPRQVSYLNGPNGERFPEYPWYDPYTCQTASSTSCASLGQGVPFTAKNYWSRHMQWYIFSEDNFVDPQMYVAFYTELEQDSRWNTYITTPAQSKRYILASILTGGNGYAALRTGNGYPEWCDECGVYNGSSVRNVSGIYWLGCPTDVARSKSTNESMRDVIARDWMELSSHVWCREFTGGLVCINPDTSSKTVNVGLGWKKIRSVSGDFAHNNGQPVTTGFLTIPAMGAYMLVRDTAPLPTETPISNPTDTPIPTSTPTPTATSTSTPTATSTKTPTPTHTATRTPTPTRTKTPTPTSAPGDPTKTWTPTSTATPTATNTPTPTVTPTATNTPTPTPTATNTATITPTPSFLSKKDPINSEWIDSHISSQAANTNSGLNANIHLDAGTVRNTPLPPSHPSTARSGLVAILETYPAGTHFTEGTLSYYVNDGFGTMIVSPCRVLTDWGERTVTWNEPWEIPGAYGTLDIGECAESVTINTEDIGQYVNFDVRSLLVADDDRVLDVKLQPSCIPNATGWCNSSYYLTSQNGQGPQPSLMIAASGNITPTATPEPIPTETPVPPATSTPIPNPTATPTPTPTATNTSTPGGIAPTATNTPTATPTRTPTPTLTPTPTPSISGLIINEVCPYITNIDLFPDGKLGNDNAVELFAASEVDVSTYVLCGHNNCIRLNGEVIPGKAYTVFYQSLDGPRMTLNHGNVTLFDSSTVPWTLLDRVSWLVPNANHCVARLYDASLQWTENRWPSIGFGNSSWSITPTPTVTPTPRSN